VPHDALATAAACLLILEGALSRRVELERRHGQELLGQGDIICPAQPDCDFYATVTGTATWRVLEPVLVAVIDTQAMSDLARSPHLVPELLCRAIVRSRALTTRMAIAQIPRLERRLELLLWHLADRWGVREPTGVLITLKLSQETLADLVSAHRTSVNHALKRLVASGALESRGRGRWLLRGNCPLVATESQIAS